VEFKGDDGFVGTSAPRLRPRTDGRVSVTAATYVTAAQQRLAGLWQRSRYRAATPDAVVCAAVHDAGWRPERALRTVTDTAVFTVNGPRGETGVLKVTTTESGMAGLRRERDVLRQLWSDEQLGDWRAVLPVPLDAGDVAAGAFLLTSRLPGRVGRDLPAKTAARLTLAAVDAIGPLHRRTQTVRVVDETLLTRWVDRPAQRIRMALPSNGVVGCLAGALRADLAGRPLTLGWTHGDFHPGNLLVSADGRVIGIVDWGGAHEQDLSVLDLAFWLLTVSAPGQPREFGKRIAARLSSERFWTPAESRLLGSLTDGDLAAGRTLLLLAWLRHVSSNLGKSDRYGSSPLWLRWNVIPVLRQVANG
jgi:Phosphotransferase enzyme family